MLKLPSIAFACGVAVNLCAAPPAAPPAPASPAAPAPLQAAPSVNGITQVAVNAGVLSSVSRINQVMTYLTASGQTGAYPFLPKTLPDQNIFSVSMEIQNPKATPIYASASFAPLTSGQSGAVYDAVQYVTQSCEYMEKTVFKDLKRMGILKKDIVMLDGGTVKIFLMPAGTGCVVIKKEIVQ